MSRALAAVAVAERGRWALVLSLTALMALLWFDYGRMVAAGSPSLEVYNAGPQTFVGKPFSVLFGTVSEISTSGFRLRKWGSEIEVAGSIADLGVGSIVSVRGTVAPDLRLTLEAAHVHRGRWLKWLLGVVTLLWISRELVRHA